MGIFNDIGKLTGVKSSGNTPGGVSGKGVFITTKGKITSTPWTGGELARKRKFLGDTVGSLRVFKNEDGKIQRETIDRKKVADFMEGVAKVYRGKKTYGSVSYQVNKTKKISYKDKNSGKIVEVEFRDRPEKRRKFLQAFTQTEKPGISGLSPDDIKRNVRAQRVTEQLGNNKFATGINDKRDKQNIKKKFEGIDSSSIGAAQNQYSVGIKTGKKLSEGDLRSGAADDQGKAHGFAGSGKGETGIVAAGVGANKNASVKEETHKSSGGGSAVVIQAFKDGAVSGVKPVQDEQDDFGGEFGVGGKVVNLSAFRNAKPEEVKTDNGEIGEPSVKTGEPNDTISLFQPFSIN
jgi:hypothetical protein